MVKQGKLSKQEQFYIEQNPEKKTICELAKELDRSPKVIAKHYTEATEPVAEATAAVTETKAESPMFKLMGRKERSGQHVATIMTKAASELSDATRPARLTSKKLQAAIHKPKG
jgi:hypothetical protein